MYVKARSWESQVLFEQGRIFFHAGPFGAIFLPALLNGVHNSLTATSGIPE
jgi:hypothetical protein